MTPKRSATTDPAPHELEVELRNGQICLGDHVRVGLERTLRLPDDENDYPLPPSLGSFPIERVADHLDRVPAAMSEVGGFIVPMHPREALWLSFWDSGWHPSALKVGAGRINAVSGGDWSVELADEPDKQDYVVVPDQPWLDGFNAGDGFVRQFTAVQLGHGYTAEEQITGRAEFGGIQLRAFEPKPGRFTMPRQREIVEYCCDMDVASGGPIEESSMGLAAGGRMRQEIYPDKHGFDTWDRNRTGEAFIHLLDPVAFREVTGREAPPSPISADHYTAIGLPWFELEASGDIPAAEGLAKLKSVAGLDAEKGVPPAAGEAPFEVSESQVVKLGKV